MKQNKRKKIIEVFPKNKKAFLDISFSLIFTFIIGGMIIFGAIYGLNRYSGTQEKIRSATVGEELKNIITSFESVSDEAKTGSAEFPKETKIISKCENIGEFGDHSFRITEELNNRMSENDQKIKSKSNYVFSKGELQGKKFNLFAKSFNFPYEVTTVVYLTEANDKYCFFDAPRDIEKELRALNQDNIILRKCDDDENKNATKICFNSRNECDVNVDRSQDKSGIVKKNEKEYAFSNDVLMYAAIFSDSNNYECGVTRLIKRTKLLSNLYMEKSSLLKNRCENDIISSLGSFNSVLDNYKESKDIFSVLNAEIDVERKNEGMCKLW